LNVTAIDIIEYFPGRLTPNTLKIIEKDIVYTERVSGSSPLPPTMKTSY
jgi:hypothetical protein